MVGTHSLAQLFGRSPIKPLQEHMKTVVSCAGHLTDFFQAANAGDWQQAQDCYQQIKQLENRADAQKREIRLHLPRSFFMPVARNDLLTMLSLQDKVANTAKDIAGLMLGRQMSFPADMHQPIMAFVESALAVAAKAKAVINEFDELLETGFGGREVDVVEKLVSALDDLEHDNDDIEITIRASLRRQENTLPPVDVMFMYRIIDLIGRLANNAQKVGDHVHIIVAR
ncbi:MAG TPA: TIGR00153 family protein [Pseudomonadales bacterium]